MTQKKGQIPPETSGIPTPEELEAIAQFTRRPFRPEELYVFSVALCDNEIDRDFERFSLEALQTLCNLYVGKTGIFDHSMKGSDQTARIFSCKVETIPGKQTRAGEPYTRLVARAYLPRTDKNREFILELDSGIKKEVSVGCAVERSICSVCGADSRREGCTHRKGGVYPGQDCPAHLVLEHPTDAYEWSFVAVPAQPEAGVMKRFTPLAKADKKTVQRGETMESIQKILETTGDSLTLTKAQAEQLREHLRELGQQAADGAAYRDDLRGEVLRLCALSQPELPADVMRGLAERMTLAELKSFRDAFEKQAAARLPLTPQLAPQQPKPDFSDNNLFKI